MTPKPFSRREFIGTVMGGLAMGAAFGCRQEDSAYGIPVRPLGKTGEKVSIIALGGWDSVANQTDREAMALIDAALDQGVTFFDNCWDYHDGRAEELMGKVLTDPVKRDRVFLMTKVCGRDYATAKTHLEDSLRRFQTDRIDLWQFHGIKHKNDPSLIFAEEGAIKLALEAQAKGKVRYIGFTGHQEPGLHLEMLNQDYEWASVQMPVNPLDAHYRSFQQHVLPRVNERDIGAIGMKSLGAQSGRIARELNVDASLLRRYALSMPISSLVVGVQSQTELRQVVEVARNFEPLNDDEVAHLLDLAQNKALGGEIEQYKVGNYGCDWYHNRIAAG